MFRSLQHWFSDLAEKGKLFPADIEAADAALAAVLFHLIRVDGVETAREKAKFEQILRDEFGIDHHRAMQLYDEVRQRQGNFDDDLQTLNGFLEHNPNVRMTLFRKLNQLIALDGINIREIDAFNHAVEVMFPELADCDSH